MKISEDEFKEYHKLGYLFIEEALGYSMISKVKDEIESLRHRELPGTIFEQDNLSLKSIHGIHLYSNVVDLVLKYPDILEAVINILQGQVYIHQSKFNRKTEFRGGSYAWHQDYVHWYYEDKIPEPKMVNVAIFLDDVNEFNSPLFLVPRSHKKSRIGYGDKAIPQELYASDQEWTKNTTDIKYPVGRKIAKELIAENGIEIPKGKAGSILFFHVDCVHGSTNNISPFKRDILILTYNRVDNVPAKEQDTDRPEYLASKNYTPLKIAISEKDA